MYCGEAEYEECKRLVSAQEDVAVEQFCLENLPEYEAHNALWTAWNDRKQQFDLFIKIDADTLIDDPKMFSRIYKEFAQNPRLTGMQVPLHDYFMDGPVFGLNCFSPKVVFTPAPSKLYADRADSGHDITYKHEKVAHLTPAGRHCAYPTDRQAFHFGLHRMKKNQLENIAKVYHAWKKHGGHGRLLALRGAMAALAMRPGHDYADATFNNAFETFSAHENLHEVEAFAKSIGAT
jgi:hypothetical protein